MKIREVDENKKQFISLLLLADEQENNVLSLMKIMEYLKLKILQSILRIKERAMGKH